VIFCVKTEEYSPFIVNAHRKETQMKVSHLALAALSALTMIAAHAENPDPSGQFAASVGSAPLTRAQVQADLATYQKSGVNPWSMSYNPLASFKSERTRAEVQAEYIDSRNAVAAMTGEDSGSAYLASRQPTVEPRRLAGDPVNAQ
jgi:hypothetical protein